MDLCLVECRIWVRHTTTFLGGGKLICHPSTHAHALVLQMELCILWCRHPRGRWSGGPYKPRQHMLRKLNASVHLARA